MAGMPGLVMDVVDLLEPASTSLQNCLKFSHKRQYLSILCDFGVAMILEMKGSVCFLTKRLMHRRDEMLEGHAWSPDDEIFAVCGRNIYFYLVSKNFCALHSLDLYYIPKDISLETMLKIDEHKTPAIKFQAAIAGPNGVEISAITVQGTSLSIQVTDITPLHPDLAIVLVEFSPDGQYLAVAALDCHFGIWDMSNVKGDQKDFWYVHLNTVRITDIAFSCNSCWVAVACWDVSYYLYTKASDKETKDFKWIRCKLDVSSPVERFTGVLPGAFVCWEPGVDCIRLAFTNEDGSWVSTLDLQSGKTCIQKTSSRGDAIKGIASVRCEDGGVFSLSLLSSKKLLLQRWSASKTDMESNETQTEDLLICEDVLGSLWLLPQSQGAEGVTLRLVQPVKETMEEINRLDALSWAVRLHEQGAKQITKSTGVKEVEDINDCDYTKELRQTEEHCVYKDKDNDKVATMTSFRPLLDFMSSKKAMKGGCTTLNNGPQTSSSIADHVKVPFIDPCVLIGTHGHMPSLPPSRDVFVLVSIGHVVIVKLPLLAYTYCCYTDSWRTLLFNYGVTKCCLTQGKFLVSLSCDGLLQFWSLETLNVACSSAIDIKSSSNKCIFLVGALSQPVVRVFDVDCHGAGDILYVTLVGRDHVTIQSIPVSFPRLGSCAQSSDGYCGTLGRLLVFRSSKPVVEKTGVESGEETGVETAAWVVLLPELNISRDFVVKRQASVSGFILGNQEELLQLECLQSVSF